jgi:hypothetical protein
MLRIPHCLDSRHTDDHDIEVALTITYTGQLYHNMCVCIHCLYCDLRLCVDLWTVLSLRVVCYIVIRVFVLSWRMASSGILRRVALVVLTRATRRNIPEEAILHSHRRKNPKSYIVLSYCSTTAARYKLNWTWRMVSSKELWHFYGHSPVNVFLSATGVNHDVKKRN